MSRKIFIFNLCGLFFLYEFLLRVFPNSIHNQIQHNYNLNDFSFSLFCSAFYIGYAIMQIPVGVIIDKLGIKKVISLACFLSSILTLIIILDNNAFISIICRLLMGITGSFAFLGLMNCAVLFFDKKHMGLLSGITQIFGTLGPIISNIPFIYLVNIYGDFRMVLFIISFFGIMLSFGIYFCIPQTKESYEKKDSSLYIRKIISKNNILVYIYSFFCYSCIPFLGAVWGVKLLNELGLGICSCLQS